MLTIRSRCSCFAPSGLRVVSTVRCRATTKIFARADEFSWASHIGAFQGIRRAAVGLFRNLPAEAWTRSGVASGNSFTVKALAYIVAGHLDHHRAVLQERYL